jgi:IPT/TIG domain-containing protein
MRRKIRTLLAAVFVAAGLMGTNSASAVQPCPSPACTDITVNVTDAHGIAISQYFVTAQRADGYNETKSTNNAGRVDFNLPIPPPNGCYQVVGRPDAYYANTFLPYKVCNDATVGLKPLYRINGISGQQKVFLGDTSATITVPVVISALSRTFPAPFANDKLPFVFEHHAPLADGTHEHGGETEELGQQYFAAPTVSEIAEGIWQYLWNQEVVLPAHEPGYYDMDWGRNGSTFSPMMECRMIWFGFGIGSISPAKATPVVTKVTVKGTHLGNNPGTLVLKGSGQVTTITGSNIVSWNDSAVTFTVPIGTKNGWVTVVPPSGVPTNAQPLQVQP